jgi:hypothetical protein
MVIRRQSRSCSSAFCLDKLTTNHLSPTHRSNVTFSGVSNYIIYRTAMDYSAVDEHPEASPWATSPQHNRTSFEAPDSPEFTATSHEHHPEPRYEQAPHLEEPSHPSDPHQEPQPQPQPAQQTQPPQAEENPLQKQKRKERPHYKLQAKITSLERNGRKDPILKFDVYVGYY